MAIWLLGLLACSEKGESPFNGDDTGKRDSGDTGQVDTAPPPTGAITGATTAYWLDFDTTSGLALSKVDVDVQTAGDCLTLDLTGPAPTSCTWNGEPATACTADGATLVVCGRGVEVGEPLEIGADLTLEESTLYSSDVGWHKDVGDGYEFGYLLSWLGGCARFAPCDARPDYFAQVHFTVHHPAGAILLCPGALTPGETTSSCDFTLPSGPMYSTYGFAYDTRWSPVELGSADGVEVVLYDRPDVPLLAQFDPADILGGLSWLSDLLGPYPYGNELRFFSADTYWAGYEHPGNIAILSSLTSKPNFYDNPARDTMLHELVHQWAGDQATLENTEDFVWKEAAAEYLSSVYEEEVLGDIGAPSYWKYAASFANNFSIPTDKPAPDLYVYYGDAYGAGPLVLFRQLEEMSSREAVLGAAASLFSEPGFLSVDDVRVELEGATGLPLSDYIDTWLVGSGWPDWPIVTATLEEKHLVHTTMSTMDGKAWPCSFIVRVTDDYGKVVEVRATYPIGGTATDLDIEVGADLTEPVDIEVDPYSEALVFPPDFHLLPGNDVFVPAIPGFY